MRTDILGLILLASLCACGGGGGDSSNSTTINHCDGEEVNVGDLDQIAAAAQEAGVEVEDHSEDSPSLGNVVEPTADEAGQIDQGTALKSYIVATCGSTIVAQNTTNNSTARVLERIASGEVAKIEIYRGR